MKVNVFMFGIGKDIVGAKSVDIELNEGNTVLDLKCQLINQYPDFENVISIAIAVNNEYASIEKYLVESDDIALIPPVSGG